MTLSIEDSILRLKAEIIAQDWRLSPKRAEQLDLAFLCLLDHFKGRKAAHAMLVMATNVLGYIKNRGASPPETIDFLKEAMAHIVSLYEDLADDPPKEEEIFQSLFARFTTLKEKIQYKRTGKPESQQTPQTEYRLPLQAASPEQQESGSEVNEIMAVHQLLMEFKSALARTGTVGQELDQLFDSWLDSKAVTAILYGNFANDPTPERTMPLAPDITPCPPTKVRIVSVSGLPIAIQSSVIAMVRPVKEAKAMAYLQGATVPLKDFSRFLLKLSGLFSGSLSLVKEGTLKKLNLPIIIPQGQEFPESPPPKFSRLMIISNGNWHGALACDDILGADQVMTQFAKQQNGDLAGVAYLEDGRQIPLLDPLSMLRREGLLLMR